MGGVDVRDRQALAVQERIRQLFGLRRTPQIRFGQFVRWVVQQNASTMNPHWKPHSERCDTLYTPFEFIGRYETLQEDILHVLGMLGWSPTLIPATHWSSRGAATNESERLRRVEWIKFYVKTGDAERAYALGCVPSWVSSREVREP